MLPLAQLQASGGDRPAAIRTLRKAYVLAPNAEDVLIALSQVSLASGAVVPAAMLLQNPSRTCVPPSLRTTTCSASP